VHDEKEDNYWAIEKVISTEDMIQENDRISLSIADFDERSLATFQLDGVGSSVDVHFIYDSTSSTEEIEVAEPEQYTSSPQIKKLRIYDVKELEDLSLESQPVYFLRLSRNSRSRLLASRKLFDGIAKQYGVTSRFKEFVVSHGFKLQEYEYAPPACRYRTLRSSTSDERPKYGYECAYGLRYVSPNCTQDPHKEKWSVRQFSVYQKFSSVSGTVVWIFIAAPKEIEPRIDSYIKKCSLAAVENPFAMHLILIETALAGWRWYLIDLNKRVQTQTEEISAADIVGENLEGFAQVKFQNRLKLKKLEDMILTLLLMLRATASTIESLRDRFSRYIDHSSLVPMKDDALSTAFHEILEESKLYLSNAEALDKCLQSASALLSDLLPYQNASSLKSIAEDTKSDNTIMRQLTEQTTEDSSSIKTITIITVVFLPATVVASFFSTQFVQIQENSIQLSAKIWIYFAITIPLTLMLIAVWLLHPRVTYWIQRGLDKVRFWLAPIRGSRHSRWAKERRNPYVLEGGEVLGWTRARVTSAFVHRFFPRR
jgi:hypothetical protein